MTNASRAGLVVMIAAGALAVGPADAQFPPDPTPEPSKPSQPSRRPPRAAGPDISGRWAGELTQIDSKTPYKFEIAITSRGAETKYPDLNCTGKLTRVGQSKSYVFFVELIGEGHIDKGGRCPDGTITVARSADKLAVGWFGSIKETTIVAYGTLAKKK